MADHFADAIWHAETLFYNGHGIAKYLLSRGVRDGLYEGVKRADADPNVRSFACALRRARWSAT